MSKIETNAGLIAAEMVEAHLNHGATIDSDEIAEKACEIAYKIHERSKEYKHDDDHENSKIEKLIAKVIKESQINFEVQHNSGLASGNSSGQHNQ